MINIYKTAIYNLALLMHRKTGKLSRKIKREYTRISCSRTNNEGIITKLEDSIFFCPFSHKMLFYQKDFPLYDRQLSHLCHWLSSTLNREIAIIDVGANVGDTVRNIGIKKAFYLCIEGDKCFAKYIKHNLKGYNYTLEEVFLCDAESQGKNYSIQSANGTGHLSNANGANEQIKSITLDNLLSQKFKDKQFDLLKIDTDGFDFKVIRGGYNFLKNQSPILFFEWDKAYCKEQGEDPISIFPLLENLNYTKCILFDNFGNYFNIVDTHDTDQLEAYIEQTIGDNLPYYYDVLAIPKNMDYNAEVLISLFQ